MRIARAALLAALTCPAMAQDPGVTARLQDATLIGHGTTLNIIRLPIRTPGGTILRDVTIELHVDAQGNVSLATDGAGHAVDHPAQAATTRQPGRPSTQVVLQAAPSAQAIELTQRVSPEIVFQQFTPGLYSAPDGSSVQIEKRRRLSDKDVPAWLLTASGSGPLTSAVWWSGPPELNPQAGRLRRAGIADTGYAYGESEEGEGRLFAPGTLIGVVQVDKTLRIVSFKRGCCGDGDHPVSALTYTLLGH